MALPRRSWQRWRLFCRLSGKTVVLQRFLLPAWQLRILRRQVKRLIFDFDDAVFLRDSFSAKGLHHQGRQRRFAATVRACDAVVAGNAFLQDEASRWTPNERIHQVPTCVDPGRYPLWQSDRAGPGVQLVWVGSSSTLQGLELAASILEKIGQEAPGLVLKLICDRFVELQHLQVLPCPWAEETEATEIASADVGISWVPDDLWSRGKCGLKVLQYMAAGLPVVANPVGVHAELIIHGETGFLAATPTDWGEAVARLIQDPHLRRRMGLAGRARLEKHYSVSVGGQRWVEVLNGLATPAAQTA
jgi:glycosyltransferase involved in cell wall biosynthesis